MKMPSKRISIIIALCTLVFIVITGVVVKRCTQDVATPIDTKPRANEPLLPLKLQTQDAKFALPFCEKKNCINVQIQSIQTQDPWLNRWIESKQALVLQDQIGLEQKLSLQAAVNAYVKKSDAWQAELKANRAYELGMSTRIAAQRGQYVLLQLGVDAKQEELTIKDRYYFYVADRRQQKQLRLLDLIEPSKRNAMHSIVQQGYQDWLKKQSKDVRFEAPKVLYWGQADWFFDSEGIGVHYRGQEISEDAPQLDIYLSQSQTREVLLPAVYQQMF